jgi:hypothetical protein
MAGRESVRSLPLGENMEKPDFDFILDQIFDECLCMREFLIRLGFAAEAITLAMPDDFKHISVALQTEKGMLALEVAKNVKPWTKDEVQAAWVKKVLRFINGEPSNEVFFQMWKNSRTYSKAESIALELLQRGIRIPNIPPDTRRDKTVWGEA